MTVYEASVKVANRDYCSDFVGVYVNAHHMTDLFFKWRDGEPCPHFYSDGEWSPFHIEYFEKILEEISE